MPRCQNRPDRIGGVFCFYNGGRFHQAPGYKIPGQVYLTGDGGKAKIADHFGDKNESSTEERDSNHRL